MKRLTCLLAAVLAVMIVFPTGSRGAQTQVKKSLPQVPITYQGDTDETIIRRAKWIEGAKKEGNSVTWWSIGSPAERKEIVDEFNKVYPSIKVEYWRGGGDETAAKLEMDFIANRHTADVVYGGGQY